MDRDSKQDDCGANEGVPRLIREAEDQQDERREDEESRYDGIAGDPVRAKCIGFSLAEDEERGRDECVEEPL